MTEMDELKPCPFCRSAPCPVSQNSDRPRKGGGWWQFIWCENCGAEGPLRQTEDEAIAAWNRRPSLSPAGVTEEQVRSAARDLLGALQKYGFPVSLAAEKALRDRGSIEANAVHVAAVGLRAALEAAAKAQPSISTGQGEPVAWMVSRPGSNGTAFPAFFPTEEAADSKVASVTVNPPARKAPLYAHPSLPAGHVAVPVEPTEAMYRAAMGWRERDPAIYAPGSELDMFNRVWRAMLSALLRNQGEGK